MDLVRWLGLLAVWACCVAAAGADTPAEKTDTAPEREARKVAIDGYLSTQLRFRNASDEDDLDLFAHLTANAAHEKLSARVNVRLAADLAGNQQSGDLLRDSWDSFDHDVQGRVYELYGKTPLGKRATVFLGRQFVDEGNMFHFDGFRLDVDLAETPDTLTLVAFGGFTVRFRENFEADNWLAGVVLKGFVTQTKTRWQLEYVHVSEHIDGFNVPVIDPDQQPTSLASGTLQDDLIAVSAWHPVGEQVRLHLRFSLLEGNANELRLRGRWFTKDGAWNVVVEWYQLFQRLFDVTNDLSPFTPMLGSYQPFYRLSGRATYRVRESLITQFSLAHRALEDENDEGTFNREYLHVQGNATWLDLADGKLDLTVSVIGYATDGNDVWAVGFSGDYELRPDWTLLAGIDYSLWKYDWFLDTEREDVWSFHVKARWQAKKKLRVEGGVLVDDDRFATYTTVYIKMVVKF